MELGDLIFPVLSYGFRMRLFLLILMALATGVRAAEPSGAPPDDGVRVAVIGYHDFSETEAETEMRIRTSKFRSQMEAIRNLRLPVISMEDFQAWKRGEKSIADKSVVITIDDGWKSVYTDAYPILKEFGYPFTLFLYKKYIDGGGRALTSAMIEEMKKNGATIGSHSVSHSYPATIKKIRKQGPDAFDKYLRVEMGESKRFLESKFGTRITSYAYPGGFQTQEMFPLAVEFGYQSLFTVLPGKVRRSSDDMALPRYVILGTHDPIFELATTFNEPVGGAGAGSGTAAPVVQTTPYPVEPRPGSIIESRMPIITVDLATAEEIDPKTIVMKVAGFGAVPAAYDPDTKTLSWQINRRLRGPSCQVQVTWKDASGKSLEIPLRWSFQIDREAAYVPRE